MPYVREGARAPEHAVAGSSHGATHLVRSGVTKASAMRCALALDCLPGDVRKSPNRLTIDIDRVWIRDNTNTCYEARRETSLLERVSLNPVHIVQSTEQISAIYLI